MKKLFTILSILLTFHAFGQIDIYLSVINKKGMDVGLSIVNEFHIIEEFYPGQTKVFDAGTDLKIRLKVDFDESVGTYGPSHLIFFEGEIFNEKETFKRKLFQTQNFIPIEKEKVIRILLEDQHIEVTLKPVLNL